MGRRRIAVFRREVDCCINAGTILIGTYLGVDVDQVVQRRPAPGSFASTLDVFNALVRWERHTGGSDEVRQSRTNGEEYLLQRHLFRSMRTGEVVHPRWTLFSYQPRWHHNMVKATDYFARRLGIADPRLIEAIEHIHANPNRMGGGCSRTPTLAQSTSDSRTRRHAKPVEHPEGIARPALARHGTPARIGT